MFEAACTWMMSFVSTDKNEQLIRSTQTLHHYVHRYFSITNKLLNIINTHFGESFSLVKADDSKSIKANCAIVRDAMCTIHEISKKKEKNILKIIEPDLYDKIAFAVVSLEEKAAVIRDFHADKMAVFGNILLPLVAIHLAKSELENVKPPTEEHDLPVLSLNLGDLLKSSESIAKLLSERGSRRTNLSEAKQLVEDAISILKPPCDSYDAIARKVKAYVKIISENI